jgi:sec-independent protein translocase protein TatC
MDEKKLTFIEHLGELRRVLIISFSAILVGLVVGVIYSDTIDWVLRLPLQPLVGKGLTDSIFLGLFDPIFYRIKIGLIGGLILASPVIFWQIWWFVAPGLYTHERRMVFPFILVATLFFLSGVCFCYFIVLPKAAAFAIGQLTDKSRLMLSLPTYLSEAATFILAFGVVFETPVVVFLLARLGVVSPQTMARARKWVLLGAFVVGAILTPTPDAVNQTIMAVPIYVLFELGLLAARLTYRKRDEEPPDPQKPPEP